MNEHTPTPWSVSDESFDNDGIQESVIRGLGGRAAIAATLEFGQNNPGMREANARRIVACVNACEGIPNVDLDMDNSKFLDAMRKWIHLRRQNADLLNMLWKALPFVEDHEGIDVYKPETIKKTVEQIKQVLNAAERHGQPEKQPETESAPAIVFFPAGSLGEEVES